MAASNFEAKSSGGNGRSRGGGGQRGVDEAGGRWRRPGGASAALIVRGRRRMTAAEIAVEGRREGGTEQGRHGEAPQLRSSGGQRRVATASTARIRSREGEVATRIGREDGRGPRQSGGDAMKWRRRILVIDNNGRLMDGREEELTAQKLACA